MNKLTYSLSPGATELDPNDVGHTYGLIWLNVKHDEWVQVRTSIIEYLTDALACSQTAAAETDARHFASGIFGCILLWVSCIFIHISFYF